MPSSGGVALDSESVVVTIVSDDKGIESATTGAPSIEARTALPT